MKQKINKYKTSAAVVGLLLILLLWSMWMMQAAHAQTPTKTVFVNWDASSSTLDVAGVYNLWRSAVLADGTCDVPSKIATVAGLTYRDKAVVPDVMYCYQTSFTDVDGGESDLSDPQVADTSLPSSGPMTPNLQIAIH